MTETFFFADNANNPDLPARFHLCEFVGSWKGVLAVKDASLAERLRSVPAVTEINEAEYNRFLTKASRLPDHLQQAGTPIPAAPRVVAPVPQPKPVEQVQTLDSLLEPTKVVTESTGFKQKASAKPRKSVDAVDAE